MRLIGLPSDRRSRTSLRLANGATSLSLAVASSDAFWDRTCRCRRFCRRPAHRRGTRSLAIGGSLPSAANFFEHARHRTG